MQTHLPRLVCVSKSTEWFQKLDSDLDPLDFENNNSVKRGGGERTTIDESDTIMSSIKHLTTLEFTKFHCHFWVLIFTSTRTWLIRQISLRTKLCRARVHRVSLKPSNNSDDQFSCGVSIIKRALAWNNSSLILVLTAETAGAARKNSARRPSRPVVSATWVPRCSSPYNKFPFVFFLCACYAAYL